MGKIGYGYGSEWQLLRYLGYHRSALDGAIEAAVGGTHVRWLDSPLKPSADRGSKFPDAEWKAIDFLPKTEAARVAWSEFWPQKGNPQNWDAVGQIRVQGSDEWVLVEAKAHVDEVRNHCQAKDGNSRVMIENALNETKAATGVGPSGDWLSHYYQYANRLAALHFLTKNSIRARLVFLYFLGDRYPGKNCPTSEAGWKPTLDAIHAHLGLRGGSELESRVHTVFLPTVADG